MAHAQAQAQAQAQQAQAAEMERALAIPPPSSPCDVSVFFTSHHLDRGWQSISLHYDGEQYPRHFWINEHGDNNAVYAIRTAIITMYLRVGHTILLSAFWRVGGRAMVARYIVSFSSTGNLMFKFYVLRM
jgi:hypothetical protein